MNKTVKSEQLQSYQVYHQFHNHLEKHFKFNHPKENCYDCNKELDENDIDIHGLCASCENRRAVNFYKKY